MRWSRDRTIPAVRGRLARPKVVIKRFTRNWERSMIFATSWPRRGNMGLEIALDIAFQCTPDHPYVKGTSRVVSPPSRRQHSVR